MKRESNRAAGKRDLLTDEQLESLSTHDMIYMKLSPDEEARLRAINQRRAVRGAERQRRLREEEQPILADLHAVGWDVSSVWDLVKTSTPYLEALPVLVKHLVLPYSDRIREGIARSLAVPDAAFAWPILLEEYKKADSGFGIVAKGETQKLRLGAKHGLGCALGETATHETLDTMIELIRDQSHGDSRLLLLDSMHRRKMPHTWELIEELKDDPDLKIQIGDWLKQRSRRLERSKKKKVSRT